jgi:hypothetical protein
MFVVASKTSMIQCPEDDKVQVLNCKEGPMTDKTPPFLYFKLRAALRACLSFARPGWRKRFEDFSIVSKSKSLIDLSFVV